MTDIFARGGFLMTPILFCSVLALAIFLERFVRFIGLAGRGPEVADQVAEKMAHGDREGAVQTARDSRSPMGRVLLQGLGVIHQDRDTLETVLFNAIDEEIRALSRYLQTLGTIANIAPLLGLLGTVIGMIKAFRVIQEMGGKVNAAVLAGGIWEAMLTTAVGLSVALLAMVAHSFLTAQVDHHEARLQTGMVAFMKYLPIGQEK